jgi:hypothetical protein
MGVPLSNLFFHWLFASIGTNANLKEALLTGPACLGFSSLAYGLHVLITLVGNYLIKKKWNTRNHPLVQDMELEDVLIASNAAIGGPATAAAFCGRMKGRRLKVRNNKKAKKHVSSELEITETFFTLDLTLSCSRRTSFLPGLDHGGDGMGCFWLRHWDHAGCRNVSTRWRSNGIEDLARLPFDSLGVIWAYTMMDCLLPCFGQVSYSQEDARPGNKDRVQSARDIFDS